MISMANLLTQKDIKQLTTNHESRVKTDESSNVVVKLFNPTGAGTWYLTELYHDKNIAYGLCCITEAEFGNVSVEELKSLKLPMGLTIEKDKWFPANKYSLEECLTEYEKGNRL
jgi:hypothetical protein